MTKLSGSLKNISIKLTFKVNCFHFVLLLCIRNENLCVHPLYNKCSIQSLESHEWLWKCCVMWNATRCKITCLTMTTHQQLALHSEIHSFISHSQNNYSHLSRLEFVTSFSTLLGFQTLCQPSCQLMHGKENKRHWNPEDSLYVLYYCCHLINVGNVNIGLAASAQCIATMVILRCGRDKQIWNCSATL